MKHRTNLNLIIAILLFAFCKQGALCSTFDLVHFEKLVSKSQSNQIEFKQLPGTPITYQAWAIWNFKHSINQVVSVAIDFKNYPKIFKYVYECDSVQKPTNRIRPNTWYVEGRAAFARVWAIGTIDSLYWKDPNQFRFIVRQNEDRILESSWQYTKRGWLNYRTHGVKLAAFIIPTGPTSCKLAIIAQGWVKNPMPVWLIRMASQLILPQFFYEINKEIKMRKRLQKKSLNWFDTIF